MKAKVNSLQAVLSRAVKEAPEPVPAIDTTPKAAPRARTAGREGTKLIGGHFPPEVSTQLRILAAEVNTTVQALLEEAISDLLTKKGRGAVGRG